MANTSDLYDARYDEELLSDPNIIYSDKCPFDPFANWPDYHIVKDFDNFNDDFDKDPPCVTDALKRLGLTEEIDDDGRSSFGTRKSKSPSTIQVAGTNLVRLPAQGEKPVRVIGKLEGDENLSSIVAIERNVPNELNSCMRPAKPSEMMEQSDYYADRLAEFPDMILEPSEEYPEIPDRESLGRFAIVRPKAEFIRNTDYERCINKIAAIMKDATLVKHNAERLRAEQLRDRYIGNILMAIEEIQANPVTPNTKPKVPEGLNPTHAKYFTENWKDLMVNKDGILVKTVKDPTSLETTLVRIILPPVFTWEVMFWAHDQMGHMGEERVLATLRRRFEWCGMTVDIKEYIKQCPKCQRAKKGDGKRPFALQPIQSAYPGQILEIDHMKLPLSKTGYQYVQVMIDHFSKYAEVRPMRRCTKEETVDIIYNVWICTWGVPCMILTDRGPQFTAALTQELFEMCQTVHVTTTGYRPQTNGLVERSNQILLGILRVVCSHRQDDWPEHLQTAKFAYNISKHKSTGFTPARLMTGSEKRTTIESMVPNYNMKEFQSRSEYMQNLEANQQFAHQVARTNLATAQRRQKRYFDKKVKANPFQPGEWVYLHVDACPRGGMHKVAKKWIGPFQVVEVLGDGINYILSNNMKTHYERMKRHHGHPHEYMALPNGWMVVECDKESLAETINDNVGDPPIPPAAPAERNDEAFTVGERRPEPDHPLHMKLRNKADKSMPDMVNKECAVKDFLHDWIKDQEKYGKQSRIMTEIQNVGRRRTTSETREKPSMVTEDTPKVLEGEQPNPNWRPHEAYDAQSLPDLGEALEQPDAFEIVPPDTTVDPFWKHGNLPSDEPETRSDIMAARAKAAAARNPLRKERRRDKPGVMTKLASQTQERPATAAKAVDKGLKDNVDGNGTLTPDDLATTETDDEETKPPPKKKRGRPKKVIEKEKEEFPMRFEPSASTTTLNESQESMKRVAPKASGGPSQVEATKPTAKRLPANEQLERGTAALTSAMDESQTPAFETLENSAEFTDHHSALKRVENAARARDHDKDYTARLRARIDTRAPVATTKSGFIRQSDSGWPTNRAAPKMNTKALRSDYGSATTKNNYITKPIPKTNTQEATKPPRRGKGRTSATGSARRVNRMRASTSKAVNMVQQSGNETEEVTKAKNMALPVKVRPHPGPCGKPALETLLRHAQHPDHQTALQNPINMNDEWEAMSSLTAKGKVLPHNQPMTTMQPMHEHK